MTESLYLKDVRIDRVVEWIGPLKSVEEMFPDTPPEQWTAQLAPHFWTPDTRAYRAAIQSWVLRLGEQVVVIDTGVGNDRDRPQVPALAHLDTNYLDRLAAVGVRPEQVNIVVNTHIHYDHVGWNTQLDGHRWVPTFPNATYLVPEPDYQYFHPTNSARMRPPRTEDERARFEGIRLVFADSIAPIEAAGQLRTWRDGYRINDRLRIEPAPGHTPGSSVVWLDEDDGAAFVGDLIHTPVQIGRPEDSCAFDLDAAQARRSRRDVLAEVAHRRATLFPAHFPGPGGVTVSVNGDDFSVDQWADIPAI